MKRIFPLLALLAVVLPSAAQTKLNAAGATFPYPIYSKWFSQYHQMHPEIEINYQSIGSGGGIAQVKAGTVDFGASDMPLDDTKVKQMPMPLLAASHSPGIGSASVQHPGSKRGIEVHAAILAGIYLAKSHPGMIRPLPKRTRASACPASPSWWFIVRTAAELLHVDRLSL